MNDDARLREIRKALASEGWRERIASDGFLLFPADKTHKPYAMHKCFGKGSSPRLWKNIEAALKRRGWSGNLIGEKASSEKKLDI